MDSKPPRDFGPGQAQKPWRIKNLAAMFVGLSFIWRTQVSGGRKMTWQEFAQQDPELAALGQQRLDRHGVVMLATLR